MGYSLTRKFLDAWVAGILFLGSGLLTHLAYGHISRGARDTRIELGDLRPGSSYYQIYQKETCVGEAEVLFEQQELTRLRMEMSIRAEAFGTEFPFHFETETFFNPMGQLVRSKTEVESARSKLSVASLDVFPIQIDLSVSSPQTSYEQQMQIPGPRLLIHDRLEGYRIEYPELSKVVPPTFEQSLEQIHRDSPLRLVAVKEKEGCPADKSGRFRLSDLNLSALPFAPQLQLLFSGGRAAL